MSIKNINYIWPSSLLHSGQKSFTMWQIFHFWYNILQFQTSDGSGTQNQPKNRFKASWTHGLNMAFLRCTPLWRIIKYAKSLAKKEEKPCSTCLKPISQWHFQNPKPRFQVPDSSNLYKMQDNISVYNHSFKNYSLNWNS